MRLEHVSKRFDGRYVISDLTHDFALGTTAITGPSGVGKSTLINLLAGLTRPDSGRVVRGAGVLGMVFQEDRLIEHITAIDNLCFAAGRGAREEARALLARLGLEGDMDRPVSEFSGGMKRRVAIARALIVQPDVLLMDEPFRGLDEDTRARAAELIRGRGIAQVIFVTHDRDEMALLGAQAELTLS